MFGIVRGYVKVRKIIWNGPGFEPTSTAATPPSPTETTAANRLSSALLKKKFHETMLSLISLHDPSDMVILFSSRTHSGIYEKY